VNVVDLRPGGPPLDEIIRRARNGGVLLFGAGQFARAVARALAALDIAVRAFVVSSPSTEAYNGIPVRSFADLDERSRQLPVWIAVFNREAHSNLGAIRLTCLAATGREPLLPQHYFDAVADGLGWRFWLTSRSDYAQHGDAIAQTMARLDDDLSRGLLADTIAFRLGQTPAPPAPCDSPQYFPDFFLAGIAEHVNFVDGGAFDGDTIAEAAQHISLARSYAFEPDPENFGALVRRAAALKSEVVCIPCGLSDRTRLLSCNLAQGEGCAIGAGGSGTIQVVRLDDILPNVPIDLFKLDIEGHECEALAGAAATIHRSRPRMAIAAYHLWNDLWRIPAAIAKASPGCRIAYRIHGHNTLEAVFYAYPSS
jgi:FkbM family methyltransferase